MDGKLACEATLTCQVVTRARERRAHGDEPTAALEENSAARHGDRRVSIHPSAVIAAGAVVPASCTVGPFCTIGPDVVLGEDCTLISHVVLDGRTRIGARNTFYPFLRHRRCAAGSEVQGRADRDGDRRRQHDSRERDHQPRHGGRRRADADRLE